MAFTAGQKLTAAGLNTAIFTPRFAAYQSVTQSLSNATFGSITFTTEIVDTHNGHSTTTSTSRYTPSVAGKYRCHGVVVFAANGTGGRAAQFRKNGAEVFGAPYVGLQAATSLDVAPGYTATAVISCNGTTDYIELWGYQSSGGSLNTFSVTGAHSLITIEWIAS